jgi:hypothetical protein
MALAGLTDMSGISRKNAVAADHITVIRAAH